MGNENHNKFFWLNLGIAIGIEMSKTVINVFIVSWNWNRNEIDCNKLLKSI